jgi:hypothetical protein
MLQINRIKCVIITANDGYFGFDHVFKKGLNFIASTENTKGKSSIIEAIYYCLGVEELLGGVNEKALTPVYKKAIDYGEKKDILPLKTSFYLEAINHRGDTITVNRDVEHQRDGNNLIKVFYGKLEEALEGSCNFDEMYVNISGGATSPKGFHKFLEEYIDLKLPVVPNFQEVDRKLYIQTLFSAMFIEQKKGWSNLLATIPNYGIRDVRTKVIEFLLNLDTIENEKLKTEYRIKEASIKQNWEVVCHNMQNTVENEGCNIYLFDTKPQIIDEENLKQMKIYKRSEENIELNQYIQTKQEELNGLSQQSLKVGNNIEELQDQLNKLQIEVQELEERKREKAKERLLEKTAINKLKESFEVVNKDLENNKDIRKLKKLGGLAESSLSKNVCPTCNQNIKDCLLEQSYEINTMTVEEQIKHLSDQKAMIEYSLNSHKNNISSIENEIKYIENEIISKFKEIRRITNDIYSTDECLSTAIVYKKVQIENEIESLEKMKSKIEAYKYELLKVSKEWMKFLDEKKKLPKGVFSDLDVQKLEKLKELFIKKLNVYNYSSNKNTSDIEISKDKLMPTLNGFDLMNDGSGSDLIRVIWSFTLSLLSTSNYMNGNHCKLVIFDEPAQQSIKNEDLYNFIEDMINNYEDSQIIVGITLNNADLENYIRAKDNVNLILIEDKAVKPIS